MVLLDLFNKDMTPNWEKYNEIFPEMATCKHSVTWHKEGSPLEHVKLVTANMINELGLLGIGNDSTCYLVLVSAAMLHDIGKPSTTYWDKAKQDWACKNHGEVGEKIFRNIFFNEDLDIRESVAYLIRYHMLPHHITVKSGNRLQQDLMIIHHAPILINDETNTLLLLNKCDKKGSISGESEETIDKEIVNIQTLVDNTVYIDKFSNTNRNASSIGGIKQVAYVMIGLPGSGKSSFAEKLAKQIDPQLPIISRDRIRVELGYCKDGEKFLGDKEQENSVTTETDNQLMDCVNSKHSFIIDNTSIRKKYRDKYVDLAIKHNISVMFVYVEAVSLEENFRRREGQIKSEVIQDMWNNMDFPKPFECNKLMFIRT